MLNPLQPVLQKEKPIKNMNMEIIVEAGANPILKELQFQHLNHLRNRHQYTKKEKHAENSGEELQ